MSSHPLRWSPGSPRPLTLGPVSRPSSASPLYAETVRLAAERSPDTFSLQVASRLIDAQTHHIWNRPELGNPVLGRGDIYRATSGLGGPLNAETLALAQQDPSQIPMFHFRLQNLDADLSELKTHLKRWDGPFGVGEIEWAHPYADVPRYEAFFQGIAELAGGRHVVVDLHTGLIDPRVVDAIVPGYSGGLRDRHGLSWIGTDARGQVGELNSALAHDPTPLIPLLERFQQDHPRLTFVLSHPLNPVGPGQPNPTLPLALRLSNVLVGTSAVYAQKTELLRQAQANPVLFDRIVFQSDGGGAAAVRWMEQQLLDITADSDVVDRIFFRNAARAFGLPF